MCYSTPAFSSGNSCALFNQELNDRSNSGTTEHTTLRVHDPRPPPGMLQIPTSLPETRRPHYQYCSSKLGFSLDNNNQNNAKTIATPAHNGLESANEDRLPRHAHARDMPHLLRRLQPTNENGVQSLFLPGVRENMVSRFQYLSELQDRGLCDGFE